MALKNTTSYTDLERNQLDKEDCLMGWAAVAMGAGCFIAAPGLLGMAALGAAGYIAGKTYERTQARYEQEKSESPDVS